MSTGEEIKKTPAGATVVESNNCLSTGEEGREGPTVHSNAEDSLNFGWFSLPRDAQNNGTDGVKRESRPSSVSGGRNQQVGGRPPSQQGAGLIQPCQGQSGAITQQQQRPDWNEEQQQQHLQQTVGPMAGGSEACLRPPSRQCYLQQQQPQQQQQQHPSSDSQRFVVSDDPDMADFELSNQQRLGQGHGHGDVSSGQGPQQEIEFVDWPLSRAAQEMLMRQAHPPAEPNYSCFDKPRVSSRPGSRGCSPSARAIPPTPMPPLQWNGYRGSNRPTYASWREQWHRDHAHPHPQDQPHYPTGRHRREQPYNLFSDYNNNNIGTDAETSDYRGSDVTYSPAVVMETNQNNNNDNKYVIKMDNLVLRENRSSYWSRHWKGDHVTNISDESIGYRDSILRSPVKSSRQKSPTITVKRSDGYGAISFSTSADKNSTRARKAFTSNCRRRLKNWASAVDTTVTVQPGRNGSRTSRANTSVKGAGGDVMEEGLTKRAKPVYKKTPFRLNFMARVNNLKEAAMLWAKKIRNGSHRNGYCQLENDF